MALAEPLSNPAVLIDGLLSAVPAAPEAPAAADPFWQRFLTSAGFGGLMALAAALIAARIAALQMRHTKAQQLRERWWETLTWVYDRAVVDEGKRAALPQHVTFAMLNQLAERAQTPPEDRLQQGAIRSILSIFETVDEAHQTPQSGGTGDPATGPSASVIRVSDPTAATLLDDLRRKLSSDQELLERANQLQYLHAAKMVIDMAAKALGATAAPSAGSQRRADAVVTRNGHEVLIQIRYTEAPPSRLAILQAIEHLQTQIAADHQAVGGLILVNTEPSRAALDSYPLATGGFGVEVVPWTASTDGTVVREALARLLPPAT